MYCCVTMNIGALRVTALPFSELLDLLGTENIEFDPPRLGGGVFRPADFS